MDTVTLSQVYAVVKDYADYRGHPSTDAEVKAFVDHFLAKQKPDPKDCVHAHEGRCHRWFIDPMSPCIGRDNCRKADMLLGVKL